MEIVEAGRRKQLELRIEVPVADMARLAEPVPVSGSAAAGPVLPSIWPAIHPRLVELIRAHRSTMIFVNSRRLAERLRMRWGADAQSLPLAKILEGGTWAAGRRLAYERRSDGSPPIRVISDGSVF